MTKTLTRPTSESMNPQNNPDPIAGRVRMVVVCLAILVLLTGLVLIFQNPEMVRFEYRRY